MEKDPKLAEPVLKSLLKYWPVTNSQKEVLFIGELEEILEMTQVGPASHHACDAALTILGFSQGSIAVHLGVGGDPGDDSGGRLPPASHLMQQWSRGFWGFHHGPVAALPRIGD